MIPDRGVRAPRCPPTRFAGPTSRDVTDSYRSATSGTGGLEPTGSRVEAPGVEPGSPGLPTCGSSPGRALLAPPVLRGYSKTPADRKVDGRPASAGRSQSSWATQP